MAFTNMVTLSLVRIYKEKNDAITSYADYSRYLLWGNIEVSDSQINLLIDVDTRNDEKHARPPSSPRKKSPKSKDYSSLILLQ